MLQLEAPKRYNECLMSKLGKRDHSSPSTPPPTPPSKTPLLIGVGVVLAMVVGTWAYGRFTAPPPPSTYEVPQPEAQAAPAAAPAPVTETAATTPPLAPAEIPAAQLKPHPQKDLPPLPFNPGPPPRPIDVVTANYRFAAEHPEILSFVPCFCGCEHSGHRANEDCFVESRAPNGDVEKWSEHGVECTICLDVATRARQMYSSGASVRDIRAAVEREFLPHAVTHTPTPPPPAR